MKKNLALTILNILKQNSDEKTYLSSSQLLAILSQEGLTISRPTLYQAIRQLQYAGFDIHYRNRYGYQYLPRLTKVVQDLLIQYIQEEMHIDLPSKQVILDQLADQQTPIKGQFLTAFALVSQAIHHHWAISFSYFDLNITRQKQYRKQAKRYHMIPYAMTFYDGHGYVICTQIKQKKFYHFRLDKMDRISLQQETMEKIPFDLNEHLKASFNMYQSDKQTITLQCPNHLSQHILDRFDQFVIAQIQNDHFTIHLQTAITPTLIGWLFQFDEIVVLQPLELKQALIQKAEQIMKRYR